MTVTAPTVPDITANVQNGVTAQLTNAQVLAQYSGLLATATTAFVFGYKGVVQSFPLGKPKVVTADLKAALQAANMPVTYS